MNQIQKLFLLQAILFMTLFQAKAQNNTQSPYSRFGLGDLAQNTYGQFQGLGGTFAGIRNPFHINFNNPASLTAFDTLSFNYEFGVHSSFTRYSTNDLSQNKFSGNFSYFAAGFPVTKWWSSGFGLLPYSNVGYTIQQTTTYTIPWAGDQNVLSAYSGSGGISQVFWANGFEIGKHLSLGLNTKYLFGTIEHTRVLNFVDSSGVTNSNYFSSKIRDQYLISDFTFELSGQYYKTFEDQSQLTFGLVFGNNSKLSSKSTQFVELINQSGLNDTVVNVDQLNGTIKLPLFYQAGLSWQNNKWLIAADFGAQNWANTSIFEGTDSLSNTWAIHMGAQYIPDRRNIMNYMARINYRAGFEYSQSYLNLNETGIDQWGINLGLGLPLRRSTSLLNINLTIGQRGTVQSNLIKENYALLGINLSLHDIWFMKRKFD